jgi:bifunctional non-homologous end joining protein LigD
MTPAAKKAAAGQAPSARKAYPLTNLDKVLWPQDGYTKGDLISYYQAVAQWLLPYLEDRPLSVQRYPDGIDGVSFFEKNAPRNAPPWVQTLAVVSNTKKTNYILCNDAPTLVYLANLACITLHVWVSRKGSLDTPDYVLFDLDPWEGCTPKTLAEVALTLHGLCAEIGLKPVVKTSGGSGLHVLIPLKPLYTYDHIKWFTELTARRMQALLPSKVTLERMTARRKRGTVYIDFMQIGKGKTLVPPFSLRARRGAPVAMPLEWSDVEALCATGAKRKDELFRRWSIKTAPGILAKRGDIWRAGLWREQSIDRAVAKAGRLW